MIESCVEKQFQLTVSFYGFNTANIIGARKDNEDVFRSIGVLLADGIAIEWTSWLFGPRLDVNHRISGDLLCPFLFRRAIQYGWRTYLLGGSPGIADRAADILRKKYPGLIIVGTHHGYLDSEVEKQSVVDEVNRSRASIVLVGMGQPLQENWIVSYKECIHAPVIMAVGGYCDHLTRRIDCYPGWVYRWRLNWAYRLITEPRRLWKKYTFGIMEFCARVLLAKLKVLRQENFK